MLKVSSTHWPYLDNLWLDTEDSTFYFTRTVAGNIHEQSQHFDTISDAVFRYHFDLLVWHIVP